jgi:hypothetical protein
MDALEEKYDDCVKAMGVVGRVRRMDAFFCWSRDYLARSVASLSPGLTDREFKLEIALRQYGSDPRMRELIRELQSRAAD